MEDWLAKMLIDENFISEVTALDGSGNGGGEVEVWERPSDWLPMPSVLATEQKFVGLLAVNNRDSNWVAFSCSGAYTVNWGDGSSPQNFSSGSVASRNIAWADVSSGTLTSEGFRQCLITVTPQAANNITAFSLDRKHSSAGSSAYSTGWLDVVISSPNLSSAPMFGGTLVAPARRLRRARWLSYDGNTISNSTQFTGLANLRIVEVPANLKSNRVDSMFSGCLDLVELPFFNTSAATLWSSFVSECHSLKFIPAYSFTACTTLSSAFSYTYSLIRFLGAINAPSCTNLSSTFIGSGIQFLPSMTFGSGLLTSMTSAFQQTSFRDASVLNMVIGVTTISSLFLQNANLEEVGPMNLSSVTTGSSGIFSSCPNLRRFQGTGMRFSISFLNCQLTRDAIVEVFTNLGTASGTQTVTVTGNPGAASLSGADLAIATGKGWTVAK